MNLRDVESKTSASDSVETNKMIYLQYPNNAIINNTKVIFPQE